MELVRWDKIKSEIAECQDIIKLTKLSYSLDAVQKWSKQSGQSLETQNEIAEYRLRLDRKRGQWVEENIPKEGQLRQGPAAENGHGTPMYQGEKPMCSECGRYQAACKGLCMQCYQAQYRQKKRRSEGE